MHIGLLRAAVVQLPAAAADLEAAVAVCGPSRVNQRKNLQAVVTRHSGTAPGGGNTELSEPGSGPYLLYGDIDD
ncbi:hypothetical protein CBL_03472 [Carabus blaptoides fortunei]